MDEKRIEWVDVYKGIAICLMVIGHITGKYNQYIYQFHMAAFFLISGYTKKWKSQGVISIIGKKIHSLLVPYLSVFLYYLVLDNVLILFNIRTLFFDDSMIYIGGLESIKQLFLHGNCYMWLLGAGWFVIVLFIIEIIHTLIAELCGYNIYIYSFIAAGLYFIGYLLADRKITIQIGLFPIDLAFIGGGFYAVGVVLRQRNIVSFMATSQKKLIIILITCLLILFYFGNVNVCTVNYPTRSFNNMYKELLAGVNGSIFLVCCSLFIIRIEGVKRLLIYLGRNTLGIVFFHFQFFKLAFLIFYLCGMVEFDYLRNFLPTDEIGIKYCLIIAIISISASILEWKILTSIKYLRFLLGKKNS